MPASSLKEVWIAAARDHGIECVDIGGISAGAKTPEHIGDLVGSPSSSSGRKPMVIGCQDEGAPFSSNLIIAASQLLESRGGAPPGLICVTGSLHLVGAVLQQLGRH